MAQVLNRETKQATVSFRRARTASHYGKTKSPTSNLPSTPSSVLREPPLPEHFPYVPSLVLHPHRYLQSLLEPHFLARPVTF